MSSLVTLVAEEGAAHSELPMPAYVFGIIALVAFALLLLLTWSFRGTAQKYAQPGDSAHGGHGDKGSGHGHH